MFGRKPLIIQLMTIAVLVAVGCCQSVYAAVSAVVEQPHIKVSLLSEVDQVSVGQSFTVGLHLNPDEYWHVYWQNPGDSGMPPRIKWDLPAEVVAAEVQWPYPEPIPMQHLMNYGYHGDVVLPVEVSLSEEFSGNIVNLAAKVSWLVCKESCIPGKANLSLSVPVAKSSGLGDDKGVLKPEAEQISAFQKKLPTMLPLLGGEVKIQDKQVVIELYARHKPFNDAKKIVFFAINEDFIEYSQPAEVRWKNNFISITQDKSASFSGIPEVTEGVLVVDHKAAWYFKLSE